MNFSELQDQVLVANQRIATAGLAQLTWGNVSGYDPASGRVIIKPSGVPYNQLRDDDLVILDLNGNILAGSLRPSSDTPTHLALYRAFPGLGGICHTHSPHATAYAQAGRPLPCYGTTHADHFYGTVPICRSLTAEEVQLDYEALTGDAIVETFRSQHLDPLHLPAVLQSYHAPFTWGPSPLAAVDNAIALEMCAQMALHALQLHPDLPPLPQHLLDKHFLRKHGPGTYYGQPE